MDNSDYKIESYNRSDNSYPKKKARFEWTIRITKKATIEVTIRITKKSDNRSDNSDHNKESQIRTDIKENWNRSIIQNTKRQVGRKEYKQTK